MLTCILVLITSTSPPMPRDLSFSPLKSKFNSSATSCGTTERSAPESTKAINSIQFGDLPLKLTGIEGVLISFPSCLFIDLYLKDIAILENHSFFFWNFEEHYLFAGHFRLRFFINFFRIVSRCYHTYSSNCYPFADKLLHVRFQKYFIVRYHGCKPGMSRRDTGDLK